MAICKKISQKKKINLVLYCFPILLVLLSVISDHSPRIAADELVNSQGVTSVEVFLPLGEKNPVIFSEEEADILLRLLSSATLTPISEEEIPVYYGGPPYIRLCSDRGAVIFRIWARRCSFENDSMIRYYYDLSGNLEKAEAYALRVFGEAWK